jgi:hypothetical protein
MNASLLTMNPNPRCISSPPRLQRASALGREGSFLHHPRLLVSAYQYSAVSLSLTASLRPSSLANRAFSPFFKAVQSNSNQNISLS